jgi:4-azaleucine resistance transporter AzlC
MTEPNDSQKSWLGDVITGTAVTAPVLMVYTAMGIAFGVLSIQAGLSPLNTVAMSFFVYAGTAQLAGIQLLAMGVPPLSIVITTLVINSRFLVMSSALAPLVAKFPAWQRFLYGLEVTDATFALHIGRYSRLPMRKVEAFTTNIVGHIVWVAATAAGVVIGATVTNIDRFGLDFGMPAMFIAILVPMIRTRVHVVVAITGGVSLLLFRLLGLSYWAIMAATATAVLAGIAMEQWTRRQPS